MITAGIARQEAYALAGLAVENGHDLSYVKQALDYLGALPHVKHRAGFLVHLVRTNWQPQPTSSMPSQGGPVNRGERPTHPAIADIKLPMTANPDLLPRQIELERHNLATAVTERQRLIAQARLDRYALFEQLLARDGRVEPTALAELVHRQRAQTPVMTSASLSSPEARYVAAS